MENSIIDTLTGTVIHGAGNGKTVGMPTANLLLLDQNTILPKYGVYSSKVIIATKIYLGVTNIGTRPSIDDTQDITIETHILDFDQDIYDQIITVKLYNYLRPTIKFNSLNEVKAQVQKDIIATKNYFD